MVRRLSERNLVSESVPLRAGFRGFLRSWSQVSTLLRLNRNAHIIVWAFEGREHTLLALHRLVHRRLWARARLVRIRGQAQVLRSTVVSRVLYRKLTDRVVLAAEEIGRRIPFPLAPGHSRVHLYARSLPLVQEAAPASRILESLHSLRVQGERLWLVVARFDPVKGHDLLLRAFARCRFPAAAGEDRPRRVRLVLVGRSESISAREILLQAQARVGGMLVHEPIPGIDNRETGRAVHVIDTTVPDVLRLMAEAHLGLIPSLSSEVICRVAVEFLLSGTPVIASRVGALAEVLEGPGNRVVAPSEQAWVDALEAAYAESLDEASFLETRTAVRRDAEARFSASAWDALLAWILSPSEAA